MRVLLAGGSGVVGTHLIPELIASGHEVIGVTRRAGSLDGTGATELVADVSHRSTFLGAVEGVKADAVIHQLTSLSKSALSFRHMRRTNRLRSEGTSTLIAAARRIGAKRFVTASAAYGYGLGDAGDDVLDETAPFAKLDGTRNDAVLAALLTNEQQVRAFGGVALRYGIFYAPGANDISPVPRNWNGLVPVVHLRDAARATVLAMERGRAGEAYNIVDDEPVTWRELQELQARADGFSPPIALPEWLLRKAAPFGAQLMTTMSLQLSNAKAKKDLKWEPEFPTVREGLALASESADGAPTAPGAARPAARKPAVRRAARQPVGRRLAANGRSLWLKVKELFAAKPESEKWQAVQPDVGSSRVVKPVKKAPVARSSVAAPTKEAAPVAETRANELVPDTGTPAKESVEAKPGALRKLGEWAGDLRARLAEQSVARAEQREERAAERARTKAAEWAAERAAKRAADEAAKHAEEAGQGDASEQAAEADIQQAAAEREPALEPDVSPAEEAGLASQPFADDELGTYNDSGTYVDSYFDPEPEPKPDAAAEAKRVSP